VIRTEKFLISRPMFAVNLDAYSIGGREEAYHTCVIAAVWFRRKRLRYNGPIRTAACGGYLSRLIQGPVPVGGTDMLARPALYDHTADCVARWDGETLWSLEDEEARAQYKALLVPMLEACPAPPPGWDAWWKE
jgi:hypothetical protein